MPCFMVGYSHAKLMADAWKVPLVEVSHQQGHVAASLWSANALELMDTPHLAWHLSGGTTELLLVEPEGKNVICTKIGGTTDISAGQLIDRTGVLLGLSFPAGKALDRLYSVGMQEKPFKVKLQGLSFSLSGMENKVKTMVQAGEEQSSIACFVLDTVADVVVRTTQQALRDYPGLSVLCSGGVASNSMLREVLAPLNPVFSQPQYSTDNAMGVAVLAHRAVEE